MLTNLKNLGINTMTMIRKSTLAEAKAVARSFKDVRLVVMGCDGQFWVVAARDAAKLRGAGYEMA